MSPVKVKKITLGNLGGQNTKKMKIKVRKISVSLSEDLKYHRSFEVKKIKAMFDKQVNSETPSKHQCTNSDLKWYFMKIQTKNRTIKGRKIAGILENDSFSLTFTAINYDSTISKNQ